MELWLVGMWVGGVPVERIMKGTEVEEEGPCLLPVSEGQKPSGTGHLFE